MNNIEIYYDIRIVGRQITTRNGAGSKLDFRDESTALVAPDAKVMELTGASYPKLGRRNGKTRWVRFRVA